MGGQMHLKVCGLKLGLTGEPSPLVSVKVKVVHSDKLCCQPVYCASMKATENKSVLLFIEKGHN